MHHVSREGGRDGANFLQKEGENAGMAIAGKGKRRILSFSFPLTRSRCIIPFGVLHSGVLTPFGERGGKGRRTFRVHLARSLVSINFHARETDYVLLPLWSGSRLWRRSITIPTTTGESPAFAPWRTRKRDRGKRVRE